MQYCARVKHTQIGNRMGASGLIAFLIEWNWVILVLIQYVGCEVTLCSNSIGFSGVRCKMNSRAPHTERYSKDPPNRIHQSIGITQRLVTHQLNARFSNILDLPPCGWLQWLLVVTILMSNTAQWYQKTKLKKKKKKEKNTEIRLALWVWLLFFFSCKGPVLEAWVATTELIFGTRTTTMTWMTLSLQRHFTITITQTVHCLDHTRTYLGLKPVWVTLCERLTSVSF